MGISRRKFLGGGLALGGALASGSSLSVLRGLGFAKEVSASPDDQEKITRSCCNPECNHCAFEVHVRNGKLVRLAPDPNFYLRPCLRGYSRLQWNYHPNRLKYPFKRVGERGEGKWERISWEEALDTIAEKLGKIRDENGPEAVYFTAGAVLSVMPNAMHGRFANAFGKGVMTGTAGQLCCAQQGEASTATLGYRVSSVEEFAYSKLMIFWGHNPAVTYIPHWRYVSDAREKGARLITIDPRYSETAGKSDQWVSIKPGTDVVLAMGMVRIIIEENLYDANFALTKSNLPFLVNQATGKLLREDDVTPGGDHKAFMVWDKTTSSAVRPEVASSPALEGEFTVGSFTVRTVFSRLKERAGKFTPDYVQKNTGVPAQQVIDLAHTYASVKPAMINSGMSGAQRTSHGEYFVQAILYLSALTGNIGVLGGGVNDTAGVGHGTNAAINAPYPPAFKGKIPATKLGEYFLTGKPYPIKAVYWQGKGLGQVPNSTKVLEGLKKMDFVVVQEHFFGDAASVADIVLPVATLFEHYDLMAPSRNFYYQLMDKAIEPMWEARPDGWIYTELAKRLGFGELFNKTEEEWIDTILEPTGLTVESLRRGGPVWIWGDPKLNKFKTQWEKPPHYWFKDTPFQTASKRFEFHASRWEDMGFEPMADYFPPEESEETAPDLFQKYPLSLTNAKIRTKVHSTYALMPWLSEIYPKGWIDMHMDDAVSRGIKDGDQVEVYNDRGSLKVTARVHTGIRPGVVSMQNGWWVQQGSNASVLSNDYTHPLSYGHTLNSTLVQVRRA